MNPKELTVNYDFSELQQRRHTPGPELYSTPVITEEMTALCYSCHDHRMGIADRAIAFDWLPIGGQP